MHIFIDAFCISPHFHNILLEVCWWAHPPDLKDIEGRKAQHALSFRKVPISTNILIIMRTHCTMCSYSNNLPSSSPVCIKWESPMSLENHKQNRKELSQLFDIHFFLANVSEPQNFRNLNFYSTFQDMDILKILLLCVKKNVILIYH